jgi:hypothetical protein
MPRKVKYHGGPSLKFTVLFCFAEDSGRAAGVLTGGLSMVEIKVAFVSQVSSPLGSF